MMEPHASIAAWNGDKLTLWTANQMIDWSTGDNADIVDGGTGAICPSGCGVLFRMTFTGSLTVLHDFKSGTLDGQRPTPGIVQAPDGSVYLRVMMPCGTAELRPPKDDLARKYFSF